MAGCLHESATSMMYCESCAARLEAKAALVDGLADVSRRLVRFVRDFGHRRCLIGNPDDCAHCLLIAAAEAAIAKAEALGVKL